MAIHHATIKKAEKSGIQLTEVDEDRVRAFYPQRAVEFIGASAADALEQMQAIAAILNSGEYRVRNIGPRLIEVENEDGKYAGPYVPVEAHRAIVMKKKDVVWHDAGTPMDLDGEEIELGEEDAADNADGDSDVTGVDADSGSGPVAVERSANGVALDGKIAYSEGTPAGDCPYSSETDSDEEYANFERWNEEWDAAADAAGDEEDKTSSGSVVSSKYKAIYAERGDITTCGDWLATVLNNLVRSKKGGKTDIETFELICKANGVDTSKYKRDGRGWEGRIRMTGRNLLAKVVFRTGYLIAPDAADLERNDITAFVKYTMPADWKESQRFVAPKAAAEPAKTEEA